MPASTAPRQCRVSVHARPYAPAMLRNTVASSRRFCAAGSDSPFSAVAAMKAGSAVCGWFAIVVPNG